MSNSLTHRPFRLQTAPQGTSGGTRHTIRWRQRLEAGLHRAYSVVGVGFTVEPVSTNPQLTFQRARQDCATRSSLPATAGFPRG